MSAVGVAFVTAALNLVVRLGVKLRQSPSYDEPLDLLKLVHNLSLLTSPKTSETNALLFHHPKGSKEVIDWEFEEAVRRLVSLLYSLQR